ncbi:MAG TPA: heavy metal resistance protein CzcA [Firmicutes bacterium]|nr:heavy metal resistance protein CzcA [Bacillota bacterium]
MDENEQTKEIHQLELVRSRIQLQLDQAMKNSQAFHQELTEVLNAYWESPRTSLWDQAQLIDNVERQRRLTKVSYQRLAVWQKMARSPYFGRIDFLEKAPLTRTEPEMIYIGISTLTDSVSGENLIYDWRSPVAGMFYDYELGYSEYQCPVGIIQGEIILKRQYKISDGRMVYMFDADLKIDDEILQQILSRSVDQRMRTIVNTIQREQNRVIRDQEHRILIVQGTAGSGKTSIALHRIAYLLYRERDRITANNILILSPNQIFIDYIGNVLPELGESNVFRTTFQEYVSKLRLALPLRIEDAASQWEYLLGQFATADYAVRIAAVHYKSSADFGRVIRNYLFFLTDTLIREYPVIQFRGQTVFSKAEWEELFFKNLAYLPIMGRLKQIRRRIGVKLRPIVYELRRDKEQAIAASGEEVNGKMIKALARLAAWQELRGLRAEVERLTTMEPFLQYRRLFEEQELFGRFAGKDGIPTNWPDICRQTLEWFDSGRISYEDSIPFLYFQGCLAGFPVKRGIRHLIVDEAQDYTALQFEILKQLFPDCYWTVLGDPDQQVNYYQAKSDFIKIAALISDETRDPNDSLSLRLNKSYRSTREIQEFTRELLPQSGFGEQIGRSGPQPQLIRVADKELIASCISRTIQELQEEGWRSIAVIAKTAAESMDIYRRLKDKISLILITAEQEEFQRGIVVIPGYLAKGLEFDAVVICDAGLQTYHREIECQVLYIACTRALHRLFLYYTGELSPFIAGINPDLYRIV